MRIVISEFISLDGVVQAPGGAEEDTDGGFQHGGWSMPFFDPEIMGGFIGGAMEHTDAILQGARTWRVMAGAWPERTGDDDPFTDWMNNVQKYVVSDTLTDEDATQWSPTTIIRRDELVEKVNELRAQPGGDVNIMGSATVAQGADRQRPRRRARPDDRAHRARRRQEHLVRRRHRPPVPPGVGDPGEHRRALLPLPAAGPSEP